MPHAPHIVIEGEGRLATTIAHRLAELDHPLERMTVPEHHHEGTAARLRHASVLVLAGDDDTGNVELALWARRLRPDLPLVVRIFDDGLAAYLADSVERLTILSMSHLAAPVFAAAVTRAVALPPPAGPRVRTIRPSKPGPDRVILAACAGLALVVVVATEFFAAQLDLPQLDALYFVWTTVMTVGYGDITLRDASDLAKVLGMGLMLVGAGLMATLFAFLTGWVVTRRLEIQQGRVRARGNGHTVIAGAGNLGVRVAALLASQGQRVVIIERQADARHLTALRRAGHHVIVGDATNDEILALAGVERAAVVMALTDSDAGNLQIGLFLRARGVRAGIVMRVVSDELSSHVTAQGDMIALSPVALAGEAFVHAVAGFVPTAFGAP